MQVTLDIPDELIACLLPAGENLSRALLEDALIQAYREERISGPQLMTALELESRFDLEAVLRRHSVWLDYSLEDLEEERAVMDGLLIESARSAAAR